MSAATLPNLPLLLSSERDMLTDIVFIEDPKFRGSNELAEARCYIGDDHPRFLVDPTRAMDPETLAQLEWLVEFVVEMGKSHPCPESVEAFRAASKRALIFRFSHEGWTFRGKRTLCFDGRVRLNLRRIPERTPIMDTDRSKSDLVMPPYIPDLLLARPYKRAGGLILVCAPVGQGKSTTLAAAIAARLRLFGGQTITMEDPCELYLHGWHGFGECVQTEIVEDHPDALAEAIHDSLRAFSTFPGGGATVFVSEIRTANDALEAVRAAQAGYLVFATLHCQSTINAVFRLQSLLSDQVGDAASRDMVASALRLVIYQTLSLVPKPLGWKRGSLSADVLFSPHPTSVVANTIRDPRNPLSALGEAAEKQRNILTVNAAKGADFEQVYKELGGDSNDL